MSVGGSWDKRNNDQLVALASSMALISGESSTPVIASSGNVAAAVATCTIEAVAEKQHFLTGFIVSGLGATSAAGVTVTVEGITAEGTVDFGYAAVAGATTQNDDLVVMFPYPIPAVDAATDIVITCPSLGTGNTRNSITAFGIYRDSTDMTDEDDPVAVASGNVANATATATIPAIAGYIAHLSEIRIEGLGASAGSTKTATVTGVAGDDLAYPVVVVSGVSTPNTTVRKRYPFGLPAEDDETDIVVSCPALGSGNTNNLVSAFGFYRPV